MQGLSYPIVDSHAHVARADLPMAAKKRYVPDEDATFPAYDHVLQALGADRAVLIQPSFLGTDNRYMLDVVGQHPERLRAVVVVDASCDEATLRDYAARGAVGIRLNVVGAALPSLTSPEWGAVLDFVREAHWHVELHCEAARLGTLLQPLFDRGCQVVVDHFGRPDPALGVRDPGFAQLLQAAASRQLWVKVSGGYRLCKDPQDCDTVRSLMDAVLDAFGADFLMWGSDWPHYQHPEVGSASVLLENFCAMVADPGDLKKILSETPRGFFGF